MRYTITGKSGFVGDTLQSLLSDSFKVSRLSLRGEDVVEGMKTSETTLMHVAWDFSNRGSNSANDRLCEKAERLIPSYGQFVFFSSIQSLTEKSAYAFQKRKWEAMYKEKCAKHSKLFLNLYLPHLISLNTEGFNSNSVFYKFRSMMDRSVDVTLEVDKLLYYTTDQILLQSLISQLKQGRGCSLVPPMRSISVSELIGSLNNGKFSCEWLRQFYGKK